MRVHKLRKIDRNILEDIVKNSNSLSKILRACDADLHGGTFTFLKKLLVEYNIDFSHITLTNNYDKYDKVIPAKSNNSRTYSIDDILSGKVSYKGTVLKKRLFKLGYLKNECVKCGLGSEWLGEPIVLQLDHINGNNTDNALSNLRILCPNCHSQTETFSGRNLTGQRYSRSQTSKTSNECFLEQNYPNMSKQELSLLLWEMPIFEMAKKYKIAKSTMQNIVNRLGLNKPPRGHWRLWKGSH